ncbi:hypothetical protein SprV_0100265900 [Sparganum proliferum]
MDEERQPNLLVREDVATGSHRQGGRFRRYRNTLNISLRHIKVDPSKRKGLVRDPPAWISRIKTDAAIYEVSRITATKAKRETRKSQLSLPRNANNQSPPTCPRCQRTFRAPIDFFGHLRTNCGTRTPPSNTPLSASSSSTSTNINLTTVHAIDVDSIRTCPHCERTFTSHIGIVT